MQQTRMALLLRGMAATTTLLGACDAATMSPKSFQPSDAAQLDATRSLDGGRATDARAGSGAQTDGSTRSELPLADGASAANSLPAALPDGSTRASAGSCYGRCGAPELLSVAGDCACDVGCLRRGDCCADKHVLCSVTAQSALCTLTGFALDKALAGTDLGFSFAHDDHVEILFGDSYGADGSDPYPNDDSQGTLPLARPAMLPTALPSPPIECQGLLTLDKTKSGSADTFAPIRLYEDKISLSSWISETPLTGFSDGAHAYMIARRGSTIDEPTYITVRDPSAAPTVQPARTVYRVGLRYAAKHFKNPTAATVARFDPAAPDKHDYGPGAAVLFLFGRGNFAGADSRELYLSQQPLPLAKDDGSFAWAPQYFAGFADDQHAVPRWTSDEQAAVPVLSNDVVRPMQHDVTWVPALAKWVMLYGGDVADWIDASPNDKPRHGSILLRFADHPWGPWSRATPAFWREHAAPYLHCDAPAKPAEGMTAGCDLDELPDDPQHSYAPGDWGSTLLDFPGCIATDLKPSQPNFQGDGVVPCLGAQRGNLYAPSVLDTWTADLAGDQGYAHAAMLYFTLATWMPYQVILASLTVHLP